MTTDKQKRAIWFCDKVLSEKFEGDIDNFKEVSDYLSQHLNEAKKMSEPKKIVLTTTRLSDLCGYISDYDFDGFENNPHWIVE